MTYEEVVNIIYNNKKYFLNLAPTFNTEYILDEMISHVGKVFNNNKSPLLNTSSIEPLDSGLKEDINNLLDKIVDSLITEKLDENKIEILNAYILLCENLENIKPGTFDRLFLISIIRVLISTARSLEDMVALNIFIYSKIKNWVGAESVNTQLSEKYLEEYRKFLKDKSSEENYCIK